MGGFPRGFAWGSLWHLEPFLGLNVPHPVLEMVLVRAYKSPRAGCKDLSCSFGVGGEKRRISRW